MRWNLHSVDSAEPIDGSGMPACQFHQQAVLGPIVRWIVSYLTVVPLFALLGRLWPLVHIACYVALWFPFQWPEKTRK